ncbi:MAG: DUF2795 domain-containing protein [Candidatus Nitrosopolaris sp.]
MNILEEEALRLEAKLLQLETAAMAKILSGIHFPKKKEEMVAYARKDKRNLDNPEKVLETIDEIPNRAYYTIVEVEKAIGKLR